MITSLSVKNYALIENLQVEFSNGMTCITGETGAGKSILLGALNLILGKRADLKLLNEIYKHLEKDYGESFLLKEICNLTNKNKHLLEINSHCIEKAPR